ncbi:MAG: hypothetical protein HQ592_13040 [Planctomycetes bacterium]|jgi:hypothetical protein|nr:hypothetical protein [Planctomycetota bacterium]
MRRGLWADPDRKWDGILADNDLMSIPPAPGPGFYCGPKLTPDGKLAGEREPTAIVTFP